MKSPSHRALPDSSAPESRSLSEVHASVPIRGKSSWRRFASFAGPGLLISVGYMDPGNWATDIAGGAKYEYQLLFVVLASNWLAILFQTLSAKLGLVTERDLAQACREFLPPWLSFILWILCEIAIVACDLAEVLGSAIALQLLFGIPLIWGVCVTTLDVLIILFLQHKGFRYIEAFVGGLIIIIGGCFAFEIFLSAPDFGAVASGFLPRTALLTDPNMLYIAVGILGATVMPHNLYLHSSIVQTRGIVRSSEGVREAIRFNFIDSFIALSLAFFVNAAILIMSAAVFYHAGRSDIAEIGDAYQTLAPLLGTQAASIVFAIALLCSGQNSTLTGTLAGQIVMEGFINFKMRPWMRRMLTRALAIVPAVIVIGIYGEGKATDLLILSQVVLSVQLSFAVVPLVLFTSDSRRMGGFVNSFFLKILSWSAALLVAVLNMWLLVKTVF